MGYWKATGKYDDGTEIVKYFPYTEGGISGKEEQRKESLKAWLMGAHGGCNYYNVTFVVEKGEVKG